MAAASASCPCWQPCNTHTDPYALLNTPGAKGSKYVPSHMPGSASGAPGSAAKRYEPGRVHQRHDAFADDEDEAEEEVQNTCCCGCCGCCCHGLQVTLLCFFGSLTAQPRPMPCMHHVIAWPVEGGAAVGNTLIGAGGWEVAGCAAHVAFVVCICLKKRFAKLWQVARAMHHPAQLGECTARVSTALDPLWL